MNTIIQGHESTLHWSWVDSESLKDFDFSSVVIDEIVLYSGSIKMQIVEYLIYQSTIDIIIPDNLPVGVYNISAKYKIGTGPVMSYLLTKNVFQVTAVSCAIHHNDINVSSVATTPRISAYTRTIYTTYDRFMTMIESDSIIENALYVVDYGNEKRVYVGKSPASVQTDNTLESYSATEALSANMGRVLNERISQEKKHQTTINSELKRLIDAKVMEVGAVPFDTRPSEGSTNPVTSEGILQFHRENHVVLTEEEFETLEKAGALVDGVFYYTYVEDE